MAKRRKKARYEYNQFPTTLFVAAFVGACALMTLESSFEEIMDLLKSWAWPIHAWQFHMGSVCAGIIAFVASLFLLGVFETRSKTTAWHSSWPWLPLVPLTALATVIHIPFYLTLLVGVIYCVWAYRRSSKTWQLLRAP
jgi:Na+/H+-dicarboxylate symporter